MLDRRTAKLLDRLLGQGNSDLIVVDHRYVDVLAAGDTGHGIALDRHRQFADFLHRQVHLLGLANRHGDGIIAFAQIPIADALAAQGGTHGIHQGGQTFLHHDFGLNLQQQMRAALQIQAQVDLFMRQPAGQTLGDPHGQEIGDRKCQAEQTQHGDQGDFPGGEIQHDKGGRDLFFGAEAEE